MTFAQAMLGVALAGGLLLGCERGLPTDGGEAAPTRVAIDLRSLHRAAPGAVDGVCVSVLGAAQLAPDGSAPLRRAIAPGDAEVRFDGVEVEAGQNVSAQLLSRNGTLLYERTTTVTQADVDRGSLTIQPDRQAPVLQVCPDTVVVDPRMPGAMTVTNKGIGTLDWTVSAANLLGFFVDDISLTSLGPGATANVLVAAAQAAEDRTFDVGVGDGLRDEAAVAVRVNPCIDFDDRALFTYGPNTDIDEGQRIFVENGADVIYRGFAFQMGESFLGDVIIEDADKVFFGAGRVARFGNAGLEVRFPANLSVRYARVEFLDQGGVVNLGVNGTSVGIAQDFTNALPTPAGITVEVDDPQQGRLILRAVPETRLTSVQLGGQELLLDNLCFGEKEPH